MCREQAQFLASVGRGPESSELSFPSRSHRMQDVQSKLCKVTERVDLEVFGIFEPVGSSHLRARFGLRSVFTDRAS